MPEDTKKTQPKEKPIAPSKEEAQKLSKKPEAKVVEPIPGENPSTDSDQKETAKQVSKDEKELEGVKEKLPAEDLSEKTEKTEAKKEAKVEIPDFRVGDTVKMFYRIIEGEKTRIQPFQGIVISKRGEGMSKTFTLRKIGANSIGVERIIPLHSPNIQKLEVVKKGKVRRAKLYYLRGRKGRAAMRIKEGK